jgi:hypothetical protein
MNDVKVIKDFISKDEILFFTKLINQYETNHIDKFFSWQEGKRLGMPFGNSKNDIIDNVISQENLKIFEKEEGLIRSLFKKIEKKIKETLFLNKDLYICSFWLAKQYPGGIVPEHSDLDEGRNNHFEYSTILYLNTLEFGGELSFVDSGYSYKPEEGDLVFFPTKTTGEHGVLEIPEERYSLAFWLTYDASQRL